MSSVYSSAPIKSETQVPLAAEVVEEEAPQAGEFLPRTAAPELTINLSAMRELANSAARSAIDRHARKHTGKQAAGRLAGAACLFAASGGAGYWAMVDELQIAGYAAIGCGLAGLVLSFTALRGLVRFGKLHRAHNASEKAAAAAE
jgi:hypothetical protein